MNYKIIILTLLLKSICGNLCSQTWTASQRQRANTASDISYYSKEEKNIILYINLVRLFPQDFLAIELLPYRYAAHNGDDLDKSSYKKTLVKELKKLTPMQVVLPDKYLYRKAKCFALESGRSGYTGHQRTRCDYPRVESSTGECCAYGYESGREMVIELLIDEGIHNVGHRKIILTPEFNKVGVSIEKHKKYRLGSVWDFANYSD